MRRNEQDRRARPEGRWLALFAVALLLFGCLGPSLGPLSASADAGTAAFAPCGECALSSGPADSPVARLDPLPEQSGQARATLSAGKAPVGLSPVPTEHLVVPPSGAHAAERAGGQSFSLRFLLPDPTGPPNPA